MARATSTPGATDSPAPRRTRRRGISLASRLAATVLAVGLASLLAATLVGVNAGQFLGRAIVDDGLSSLRASGSFGVVAQLSFYERLAEQLAGSTGTVVAIDEFSDALDELSSTSEAAVLEQRRELAEAYEELYLEPLREGGEVAPVTDVLSDDPAAVYLQAAYSIPGGPADPIAIDDAADGSAWTDVHARLHPVYRNAVQQAGLLDILLVDATTERVVYSASKGPELGTNLEVGPFSGTVVARAASSAADSDDGVVTDLSFYPAVPRVPVGAAAAPVLDGDRLIGQVVLTYDGSVYTERLSSLVEAATPEDLDLGTDDLYLIGADGTTRSDPQSYLADPEAFLDAAAENGALSAAARDKIERNGTTVLVLPAVDATVNAALDGTTEVTDGTSITGVDVVGGVAQIPVDDISWYSVAEVDAIAAASTVSTFSQILLIGAAIFVVALAFVAVAWARWFMRPVLVISERLGRGALAGATEPDFTPVTIPDRSPIEFHRLADSFTAMAASLREQQFELRDVRADRLDVLEGMLPTAVAQRIARGDIESLDEVDSATVVVVVVLGLGGLVHSGSAAEDRRLLDDLHAELDGIAFEHGVDRIKVVGDSYFGVCGHDRPYIDHAPRSVAFALRVRELVHATTQNSSAPLDTAIGINTGPVSVGISGGARLVYDVWGATVTEAHGLARAADAGEIVVADATKARLPDEIALSPWHVESLVGDGRHDERAAPTLWSVAVTPVSAGVPTGAEEA